MDLRRRARDERRQRVLGVALRLFAQEGYDATTVEAISEAAGVSPRSFYRYFEAKDGVIAELGTELVEDAVARLIAQGDRRPSAADLARLMGQVADERHREGRQDLQFRLFRERPELGDRAGVWRERWIRLISARLAEQRGAVEPSLDEAVVARLAVALMASAIDDWLSADGPRLVSDSVESVIVVARGQLQDLDRRVP